MNITVRPAHKEDLDAVAQLYESVHHHLENTINYPGWKKDVYPVRQDAAAAIEEKCLFVATENNAVIGTMILRHEQGPAYHTVQWSSPLGDADVFVLHTFAVSPRKLRCGVGATLLDFAAQYAKSCSVRALRLDVYETNFPAIDLYKKCGYRYVDTVSLGLEAYGLEAYGLNLFQLYEKEL